MSLASCLPVPRHANMHVHIHMDLISSFLPAQKTYTPRAEASHRVLCLLIHYIHLTFIGHHVCLELQETGREKGRQVVQGERRDPRAFLVKAQKASISFFSFLFKLQ